MRKNILHILIAVALLVPFATQAAFMAVTTGNATGITMTSATLNGYGGNSDIGVTDPVTAYFRYSSQPIAPIFCNDIYGTNMISTRDLDLGSDGTWKAFRQDITNLTPDTTYYYCAIISNRDNIAYGSEKKVLEFHTTCASDTTVETESATNIQSSSALLRGSYCSKTSVRTSFAYREANTGQAALPWKKVGEANHVIGKNNNVYGNLQYTLTGLISNRTYQFKAVAETGTGANLKATEGPSLSFNTLPSSGGNGGGSTRNDTTARPIVDNRGTVDYPTYNPYLDPYNPVNGIGGPFEPFVPYGPYNPYSLSDPYGPYNPSNPYGPYNPYTGPRPNNNGSTVYANKINSDGTLGNNTNGNGIASTANLQLGQIATPPQLAVVRFHEGIETVLARQIVADSVFAAAYGYQAGGNLSLFAGDLAHLLAKMFGYVDQNGREIRVSRPDVAAYQIVSVGNQLTIYEYYYGKIVDIRKITAVFKNASGYEYYFKK